MPDPIRAILYRDRGEFRADKIPGSFWLPEYLPGTQLGFWFICPCGCGITHRLTVGAGFKPVTNVPSWRWNGSEPEPTLFPSVNIGACGANGWHGWLRDGYWEVV